MPTIDSNDWAQKRIAFLEEQLRGEVSDEQRAAIEKELEELKATRHRWRWLWPVRLPHQR